MTLKAGAFGLALSCLAGTALAENVCAGAKDLTALQVASVQQELMVAALTCKDAGLYNSFVLAYQKDLQASDNALLAYFQRANQEDGTGDYHRFKTKLANLYSLKSLENKRAYCRSAELAFASALNDRLSLSAFALAQPVSNVSGSTACGDDVVGVAMHARPLEAAKPAVLAGAAIAAGSVEAAKEAVPALPKVDPPSSETAAPLQPQARVETPTPPNRRVPAPPLRNYRYDARDRYARDNYYGRDPNTYRGPSRTNDPYYDYYRWYYDREYYRWYGTPPQQYWRR